MNSIPLSPSHDESPLFTGCVWSSTNWSCTYDCVMMSIVYAFLFFNDDVKVKWSHQTPLTSLLTPLILRLISLHENIMSFDSFNHVRDKLHDYLSLSDPIHFQRFGTVGAPVQEIFEFLKTDHSYRLSLTCNCSTSTSAQPLTTTSTNSIPTILFSSLWTSWIQEMDELPTHPSTYVTTQDWIDLMIRIKQKKHQASSTSTSNSCPNIPTTCDVYINDPPPLLVFEIAPDTIPNHMPSIPL